MLGVFIEYFAWGLLLAAVITSVAIVHRETRDITRTAPGEKKSRGQAR